MLRMLHYLIYWRINHAPTLQTRPPALPAGRYCPSRLNWPVPGPGPCRMVGRMMDPYDDDDCAYMGDDWPDDLEPEESEADYYPEPLYGQ